MNIIDKKDLTIGGYYHGKCRNASVARWDGQLFWHWRTKWGTTFLESIHHPEDDAVFDVFQPYGLLATPPDPPIEIQLWLPLEEDPSTTTP